MTDAAASILITADAVGGVFYYALDLARELTARNMRVTLAVLGPAPDAAQRQELERVAGLRVECRSGSLEWMDDPFADVDRAGEWLLRLADSVCADLVHLNGYCHAALSWSAPTLVVAHSCVLGWWRAVHRCDAPARYDEYRRRVALGLARAGHVVAPSAGMLRSLRELHGFCGPATVIPNGVDSQHYASNEREPIFLAAGRLWDAAKNLELVARVAPALPWPVHVAGERGEGVVASQHLCWLGRLSRQALGAEFARASVFLHPARYEPFGLAPLEAALSGSALVLGEIDSLREIWGDAALYVPVDDEHALRDSALALAGNATLRRRFGARARDRALRYSLARAGAAYLGVYRRLLDAQAALAAVPVPFELQLGARA